MRWRWRLGVDGTTPQVPGRCGSESGRIWPSRGGRGTDGGLPADLPERILGSGFAELAISSEHAITAGRLPLIHRDPFDRMLVAQARGGPLTDVL